MVRIDQYIPIVYQIRLWYYSYMSFVLLSDYVKHSLYPQGHESKR